MSSVDAPPVCPACGEGPVIGLQSGALLCVACRAEWEPGHEPAPNGTTTDARVGEWTAADIEHYHDDIVAAVGHPIDLAGVLGPPDEVVAERDAQAALDALIGTEVELEGGQRATVLDFPDDDHVNVAVNYRDDTYEVATVAIGDVVRSFPPAPAAVEVDDETATQLASTAATVAILCLRAGAEIVERGPDGITLAMPPDNWLPADPEMLPTIEQGVAYAIAALIVGLDVPADMVEYVIDDLSINAQAGLPKEER